MLKKSAKKKLLKKLIMAIIVLAVLSFLSGTVVIAWASKDLPDPDKLTDRQVAQSTKIYDRTGKRLLYEIFSNEKRTIVEWENIPQNLINAVIATEDTKFYEHKGIRPLSIFRAFVKSLLPGRRIEATSTITQQLVKNAILTNERRVGRKLKEIILSLRLEQKYSKEQILKIYFNEIPYGSTNYGAESAAQSYFGKHVSELDLQESATLAGLPKAPTRYLNDPIALKQRRDFVLRRMFEEGYITEEQKNAAQAWPLTLEKHYGEIEAPHFVLYVKEQLVSKFGEQAVDIGGYKVITTLDWEMQKIAEKIIEDPGTKILEEANANNTALVALNPQNGEILAMVGSKNFNNEEINGQFNVATLGKRQPGSSFKPIVYAAAFEKGYTPDTILYDVVTDFAVSGPSYRPLNYDLEERGPVTMRQALQGSLNIPAVKTLYLVGSKKGVEFAERLGYTTLSEGNFGLTLVLGGGEVKLLEHVAAYGVFANSGIRHQPVSILLVEDDRGDVLLENKKNKGEKVLDEQIADLMSNILSDDSARSYIFGAGGVLTLPDRPVAAKTGTTDNYVDAWTVGYTPSLAVGVWAGNTNNAPMKKGSGGSMVAAKIWNAFMKEALKDSPVEGFPEPPANDAKKPTLRGSTDGSVALKINKVTGRLATSSTPEHLIVERSFIQPHSILHYVDKDNPRGDYPTSPGEDPQYDIWEAAIQDWIKRKKEKEPKWEISFEEPPTAEDDEYSIELMPSLSVIYPAPSSTIKTRQIKTDIRANAPRGVTKVTYKLDERFVSVLREYPFNLDYYARDFAPGAHTLTILVEDDIGNRLEEKVPFILDVPEEPPGVSWIGKDLALSRGDFPHTLFLSPFKLEQINKINLYAQKSGEEKLFLSSINDFSNLFNNQITFVLNSLPSEGEWALIAEVELKNGAVREGERHSIVIN
ncbi:MAG: PBP1A family penicillin-binding protein [Patescibacteria group bacterium]